MFRCWDTYNNTWEFPSYMECESDGILRCLLNYNQKDRYDIQQFTGIRDVNGVPIYDQDIVQYYFNDPEITWTDVVCWEHTGWVLLHVDSSESGSAPLLYIPGMVVVGNRMENKNLLE